MLSPAFVDQTALCVTGTTGVLAGVFGLVWRARSGRPAWRLPLLAAALLALAGGGGFAVGLPAYAWQPALVLAPVGLLFALARLAAPLTRLASGLLSHPQGQAFLLLAGGGAVLAWQVHAIDADLRRELAESNEILATPSAVTDLAPAAGLLAHTDAGATVPLYRVRSAAASGMTAQGEADYLRNRNLMLRVIQTQPITLDYNCHGWVFAAGRCWVGGPDVDRIVRDNHYQVVSHPARGDLALFRDERGKVQHSALVRTASDDGLVLLESKWGALGRYVHAPGDHPYTNCRCVYYRTPRGSHVLHGLDEARPTPAVAHAAAPG
jgi:hypothetical protein